MADLVLNGNEFDVEEVGDGGVISPISSSLAVSIAADIGESDGVLCFVGKELQNFCKMSISVPGARKISDSVLRLWFCATSNTLSSP